MPNREFEKVRKRGLQKQLRGSKHGRAYKRQTQIRLKSGDGGRHKGILKKNRASSGKKDWRIRPGGHG